MLNIKYCQQLSCLLCAISNYTVNRPKYSIRSLEQFVLLRYGCFKQVVCMGASFLQLILVMYGTQYI